MKHKHYNEIIAWAEGKQIQLKTKDTWVDFNQPHWNAICEYRVKPEQKPDYYLYAGYNDSFNYGQLLVQIKCLSSDWKYKIKITIDGETNKPKKVELM